MHEELPDILCRPECRHAPLGLADARRERDQIENGTLHCTHCGRAYSTVRCRFPEVALAEGERVIAVDYSTAVHAAWNNHGGHPHVDVVQADIRRLPFRASSFDIAWCLGALQHIPDRKAAFLSLVPALKPHGQLIGRGRKR